MATSTGRVSVQTGSPVVSGSLTSFVAAEGDQFILRGLTAVIAQVVSPSQIRLKQDWTGPSISNADDWDISLTGPSWQSTVTTNRRLTDLLNQFEAGPIKWDAQGPMTDRAKYNDQGIGFTFLSVDPLPFRIYTKLLNTNSSSDWSQGQILGTIDAEYPLFPADIGLGSVNNTSDAQKAAPGNPVGDALAGKADASFAMALPGASTTTLAQKVRGLPVFPADFLPTSWDGDWGPVLTASGAAAAAAYRALDISGMFATRSKITWPANLRLTGKGYIVGQATTPQSCIVEMIGGSVVTDGSIEVMGGYSTLYECGYWVHGDQVQYLRLTGMNAAGVQLAYRIGDYARPGAIVSESIVGLGHTYGCPKVAEFIGVEGYIEVVSPIWSADHLGGNAAWAAIPKFGLRAVGSSVGVGGGHVECTGATNGTLFIIEPLLAGSQGLVWGQIWAERLVCETAMPLGLAYNPNNLSGPNNTNRRGVLSFSGLRGAHSQDSQAFIYGDASFDGRITVANSCNFWFYNQKPSRSFGNIFCANPNADIYVEEGAFDPKQGFQDWLAGTAGGIAHYSKRVVLFVTGLSGRNFAGGQLNPLVFKNIDNNSSGALSKFAGLYNQSTGEFVVPPEGMRDVTVKVKALVTGGVAGRLYIFQNDSEATEDVMPAGGGGVEYYYPSLPGGTKIKPLIVPDINTSGSPVDFLSYMTIEASR